VALIVTPTDVTVAPAGKAGKAIEIEVPLAYVSPYVAPPEPLADADPELPFAIVALPAKATVPPAQISAELAPSTVAVGLDGAAFNVETVADPSVPQQVPFTALA
jgi:hypothetical protein